MIKKLQAFKNNLIMNDIIKISKDWWKESIQKKSLDIE